LDLPSTIKIHPVVNISRVHRYKDQVEGQKKERPAPVVIKRKEEYYKGNWGTRLQENPQRLG